MHVPVCYLPWMHLMRHVIIIISVYVIVDVPVIMLLLFYAHFMLK